MPWDGQDVEKKMDAIVQRKRQDRTDGEKEVGNTLKRTYIQ
jgi:hypothetical protein